MGIHNFSGPIRTSRPLSSITQLGIISLMIAGSLFFIYYSFVPFISDFETPEISQGVIVNSEGGICQVLTDDELVPTKLITNCNLDEGTTVSLSYQKGLPHAKIISEK